MSLPTKLAVRHTIKCTLSSVNIHRTSSLHAYSAARSAAAYVSQEVTSVQAVPVPLCHRTASHVELVSSLIKWKVDTGNAIKHINDAFESADGGPASSELQVSADNLPAQSQWRRFMLNRSFTLIMQREVTWVLDDAVAALREHEQQQWRPCSWQQLEVEYQTAARRRTDTTQWQVQLRAPIQQLEQLWRLRLQDRVPFQYLIHTAHWRDLVLSVGPGILVPRPETEFMVDLAAAAIAANQALAAAPWADLGTGSGAIVIATAKLLQQACQTAVSASHEQQQQQQQARQEAAPAAPPQEHTAARVFAVDLSPTAVAYTLSNAERCGVQAAVRVLQGSWFEPLQDYKGQLGGVLSNPPYIPRVQMGGLQKEVGQHEPWGALDGGPESGMDSLQVICEGAAGMLMPGGFLALETAGADQVGLVKRLLEAQQIQGSEAFTDVTIHDDCFGVPRFVSAIRKMRS